MANTQTRTESKTSSRCAPAMAIAYDSHVARFAWSLFIVLFLTLATLSQARAEAGQVAALSKASKSPVAMTSSCDNGVTVFSVQNKATRWATRGWLRVSDAVSGRVLRQRHMVLGDNQTATFRIQAGEAQTHRYQVAVVLPGRVVTRVKRFAGRCDKGVSLVRTARR